MGIYAQQCKCEEQERIYLEHRFQSFLHREKIVQLTDPDLKADLSNGWFVGQPISVIYDYKKIGIWQTSEAAQAAVYGVKPGDIKIEDVNKDNSITCSRQADHW